LKHHHNISRIFNIKKILPASSDIFTLPSSIDKENKVTQSKASDGNSSSIMPSYGSQNYYPALPSHRLGRSGPLLSHGRYEFFLPIHLLQDAT